MLVGSASYLIADGCIHRTILGVQLTCRAVIEEATDPKTAGWELEAGVSLKKIPKSGAPRNADARRAHWSPTAESSCQ